MTSCTAIECRDWVSLKRSMAILTQEVAHVHSNVLHHAQAVIDAAQALDGIKEKVLALSSAIALRAASAARLPAFFAPRGVAAAGVLRSRLAPSLSRINRGKKRILQKPPHNTGHTPLLKIPCGGGVPSSHPSLGLSVFFLSFTQVHHWSHLSDSREDGEWKKRIKKEPARYFLSPLDTQGTDRALFSRPTSACTTMHSCTPERRGARAPTGSTIKASRRVHAPRVFEGALPRPRRQAVRSSHQ